MKIFMLTGVLIFAGMGFFWKWGDYFFSREYNAPGFNLTNRETPKKTREELVAEALEKSSNIKGLYMTADVANDQGVGATRLRESIIKLADTTEINGIVIDVKEVCGADYDEKNLKELLKTLKEKNIWSIARVVVFKDSSQSEIHPDWYLSRSTRVSSKDECSRKKYLRVKSDNLKNSGKILWQDKRGGYWMDPASPQVRNYVAGIAKKMIDLGFDEIQFDYIRFPSDGDVSKAVYPFWDGKGEKFLVMKSFFQFLNKELKSYKPDIILSADLFGYATLNSGDVGIGQRLEDLGDSFDYISFMVYPSHYYSGLILAEDPARNLPAINYNVSKARSNPGVVVERSLLIAKDFLDAKLNSLSSTTASTTVKNLEKKPRSHARLRPWLEDFYHDEDKAAGRPWGAQKVRLQIEGAEKVEDHGWLLWNAANVYMEGALKRE